MNLNALKDSYSNPLLHKTSKKYNLIFMLGHFNEDLLKYENHALTNEFLGSVFSHMFLPHIEKTRVTNNPKTRIDDIFFNTVSPGSVSGNLIATIYGHQSQFAIASSIFSNSSSTSKSNISERDRTKFDQEKIILDYLAEDWKSVIKTEPANANLYFQIFVSKINLS